MATGYAEQSPIYLCFLFEHRYQLIVYLNALKVSVNFFFDLPFNMNSFFLLRILEFLNLDTVLAACAASRSSRTAGNCGHSRGRSAGRSSSQP